MRIHRDKCWLQIVLKVILEAILISIKLVLVDIHKNLLVSIFIHMEIVVTNVRQTKTNSKEGSKQKSETFLRQ